MKEHTRIYVIECKDNAQRVLSSYECVKDRDIKCTIQDVYI